MDEDEATFPMDVDPDPSSRPWKFRPEGYLVVVLSDADEGQRAAAALATGGFTPRDVKLYTSEQILENHRVYAERRTITGKVIGSVADDAESRDLYLGYARDRRSALWMRIPDEADVAKALRLLADYHYLHARHYGAGTETDFAVS